MNPFLPKSRTFVFGEFELQLGARQLMRDGRRVQVGSKAFEVLTCLVTHAGEVVTKEELLKAVWPTSFVEESNLSQHVFALRKALGDRADLIATVPGRGYQFTGTVREPALEQTPDETHEVVIQTIRERAQVVFEETSPAPGAVSRPSRGRWVYGVAAAAAVAASGWWGWTRMHPAAEGVRSVMVADFANQTGDETFDRTLKRALEIDLGQSPSMTVMSAGEAVSALGLMGKKSDTPLTGEVAREACVRGNRQILLSGAIASVGKAYLLTLEATECASGRKLAAAKEEASTKEGVLGALDAVADKVRSKMGESAKSLESYQVPISEATTTSLEALKAYSMGQYLAAQGKDETDFIGYYQRAVELDPKFAMAYGAMANTYYNLNEFDLASANYKKAFELSDRVSAKERLILEAHYYGEGTNDVVQAVKVYQMWSATYPGEWAPVVNICNGYSQIGQALTAIPACEQGLKMAPERAIAYSVLTRALKDASRLAEAKEVGAQAVAHGKDSTGVHASLFEIALTERDDAAIVRETAWAADHSDAWYSWTFPFMQGGAAARDGRYRAASELFRRAYEAAVRENLPESAQDILQAQAQIELELGMARAAKATLARLPQPGRDDADLAMLKLELGDTAGAERFLAAHANDPRAGTMMAFVKLPLLRAKLALGRGQAREAVAALEPATPFELASYDVPALRAEAYLKGGQAGEAALEYKKILMNPGVDGTSPVYPLAHLGLARAYAAAGDAAASQAEYESFLAGWKDADPEMPLLKAARAEMGRISR
jgi:DNA-binding winged helix-turn-helix (wHTH) protein/tetratricopeptide (TPR) repeat protein